MEECLPFKQKVTGSNPVRPTKLKKDEEKKIMNFENLVDKILEKVNYIKFYKTLKGQYVAEFHHYPNTTKYDDVEAETLKNLFRNIEYAINKKDKR